MNEVNETAYHANETLFIGGESDHEPVAQKRPRSGSFPKFISEAFPSPPSLAFRMSDEDSTEEPVFIDKRDTCDTQLSTDQCAVKTENIEIPEANTTRSEFVEPVIENSEPEAAVSVPESGAPISIMPSLVPGSIIDMVNVPVKNEIENLPLPVMPKTVEPEIPVAEVQSESEMDDTITGAQSFHLDFSIDESKMSISEPILEKSKVLVTSGKFKHQAFT